MAQETGQVEWAGVGFFALSPHDARMFRQPGLYGYARRSASGAVSLLYLDHADLIACAVRPGASAWMAAVALGMNEVHLCLKPAARIDRLQLRSRIIRATRPVLNLVDTAGPETMTLKRHAPGVA